MTVREIERRVGEGSITEETFLWREGMDGWKQIPEVPELYPILTRSLRPIAAPPPSMPMQAKAQRLAPQALTPAVAQPALRAGSPHTPTQPVASHPLINEQPSPVASGATPKAAQTPTASAWSGALDGLDDPNEAPTLQRTAAGAALTPPASTPNPLTTFEAPPPHIDMPAPMSHGLRPSYDSLVMQLKRTRKQHPLVIPFAVVAAVVFGVTIGFVLFGDQKTKFVKQIVEVPAKAAEAHAANKSRQEDESGRDPADDQKDGNAAPAKDQKPGRRLRARARRAARARPRRPK
jgi:hypothetical protein